MMPRMPHKKSAELTSRRRNSNGASFNTPDSAVPRATRVRNRRKRYLDLNGDTYFGPHLELADPLLYDRLVRRFLTVAERETEGRIKGYSGVLEADLCRSEAKMEALRHPDPGSLLTYKRGPNGEILAESKDEVPANKDEGYARWKWEMEDRFIRGVDEDFDYETVDNNDKYDDHALEELEEQDRYFDEQEPEFMISDDPEGSKLQELQGETGLQDF
ncbi:hypothetical protein DV736_g3834, partial [Chaetothyriales sp. CBS 134916]